MSAPLFGLFSVTRAAESAVYTGGTSHRGSTVSENIWPLPGGGFDLELGSEQTSSDLT